MVRRGGDRPRRRHHRVEGNLRQLRHPGWGLPLRTQGRREAHNAKLGRLYKPVYFNHGIAIHGAGNVPDHPASRGCVRFPMHIAEYLQDLVSIGDSIYVFDGVEEPKTYGAQPMIFDWPDPDWVPPTTTTTAPLTTTVAPTTTVPVTTATTVPVS